MYAYELPPPTSVGPGSEMSGDEERLSIGSTRSGTQREAAQTFTTIQRTVRPGSKITDNYYLLLLNNQIYLPDFLAQLNGNRTISINEETSLNENTDVISYFLFI